MDLDTDRDRTVGFVGLGEMGLPMAENVLNAGFKVVGFDVNDTAMAEFRAAGGKQATSPADVAEHSEVVHVVVRDDEQATDVAEGSRGIFEGFAGADGPRYLVVHSTIRPATCIELAERAPEVTTVVDAPVSGMRVDAETGDLSIIVGGPTDAVERLRPIFEAMGQDIYHLGELGSGEVGKLSNNLISLSNIMTTAEGIRLGTAFGIDEADLLSLFEESTADSWIVRNWGFITEDWGETHPGGYEGASEIVSKDLRLTLELAANLEQEVPGAGVASQRVPELLRRLVEDS